jgi:hypothetical protein
MTVFDGGYPIKQVRGNPNMLRTDTDLDGILNYVGLEKRAGFHNILEDARLTYQAWERLVQKFRGNKTHFTRPSRELLEIKQLPI